MYFGDNSRLDFDGFAPPRGRRLLKVKSLHGAVRRRRQEPQAQPAVTIAGVVPYVALVWDRPAVINAVAVLGTIWGHSPRAFGVL